MIFCLILYCTEYICLSHRRAVNALKHEREGPVHVVQVENATKVVHQRDAIYKS